MTTVPSRGVTLVESAPAASVSVTTQTEPVRIPSKDFEAPAASVKFRSMSSLQFTLKAKVAVESPSTVLSTMRRPWGPTSPPVADAMPGKRPITAMIVPASTADVLPGGLDIPLIMSGAPIESPGRRIRPVIALYLPEDRPVTCRLPEANPRES